MDRKKYLESQLDEFASLVEDLPESEVPAGMDRKKLLTIIGAGGAALSLPALLAACGGSSNSSSSGVGNFPETPKWKFVFVNHVTTNPFFVPTQYGIEDTCAIVNTTYTSGPARRDQRRRADGQRDEHRDHRGRDGICVCLIDAKAFEAPIKKALGQGSRSLRTTRTCRPAAGTNDPRTSARTCTCRASQMGERIVELVPKGDVASSSRRRAR